MNAYSAILPLEEVKNDLRLDPDFTEDDNAIDRMIASAFGYISKRSNHIFLAQDKTYHKSLITGQICVYDYPINTDTWEEGIFPIFGSGYMKICNYPSESITINVGYSDREQVPADLIEAALRLVKNSYYNSEEKNMRGLTVTDDINTLIDQHKRFIIA